MSIENSLKNLADTLNNFSEDALVNFKKCKDDNLQGYYEGKEQAYKLAAKWVLEIIEDTKK